MACVKPERVCCGMQNAEMMLQKRYFVTKPSADFPCGRVRNGFQVIAALDVRCDGPIHQPPCVFWDSDLFRGGDNDTEQRTADPQNCGQQLLPYEDEVRGDAKMPQVLRVSVVVFDAIQKGELFRGQFRPDEVHQFMREMVDLRVTHVLFFSALRDGALFESFIRDSAFGMQWWQTRITKLCMKTRILPLVGPDYGCDDGQALESVFEFYEYSEEDDETNDQRMRFAASMAKLHMIMDHESAVSVRRAQFINRPESPEKIAELEENGIKIDAMQYCLGKRVIDVFVECPDDEIEGI